MTEKLTMNRQPRQKTPFVTKADTASDELKARTLEAMAKREQENKGKIKSIRNMPKLALVAAIIVLTLLATGAAFALRHWWEDLFAVNQMQTVNGYSLTITQARLASDFLFIDAYGNNEYYLHFKGIISDDKGNQAELHSGYDHKDIGELGEANTYYAFVPDIKNVIHQDSKKYHCNLEVYAYKAEKYADKTGIDFTQMPTDAVFDFTFDIDNDYVKSSQKSKSYDLDYRTTVSDITFDFQKMYVSEVETFILVEMLFDNSQTDEVLLPNKDCPLIEARILTESGEYIDGTFSNYAQCISSIGSKYYTLLSYYSDNEYDDRFGFDVQPPFKVEINSIEMNKYRKSDSKKIQTQLDDIDIPVKYEETDKGVQMDFNTGVWIDDIGEYIGGGCIDIPIGDLTYHLSGIYDERNEPIVIVNNDEESTWYINAYANSNNGKRFEFQQAVQTSNEESGYLIVAGCNGDHEVMMFRLDEGFCVSTNNEEWEGGFIRSNKFRVSKNPSDRHYIDNYYHNKLDGNFDIKFNEDISQWLNPDADDTIMDFNKTCQDLGVNHLKILAAVTYVEFHDDVIETADKALSMKHFKKGDVVWVWDNTDDTISYEIRTGVKRYTYVSVNPDYYKKGLKLKPSYQSVPHYITKTEPTIWISLYAPERKWTAEEFTFAVK